MGQRVMWVKRKKEKKKKTSKVFYENKICLKKDCVIILFAYFKIDREIYTVDGHSYVIPHPQALLSYEGHASFETHEESS